MARRRPHGSAWSIYWTNVLSQGLDRGRGNHIAGKFPSLMSLPLSATTGTSEPYMLSALTAFTHRLVIPHVPRLPQIRPWLIAILLAIADGAFARADDWPQWRGPQRDGVWRETGILAAFARPSSRRCGRLRSDRATAAPLSRATTCSSPIA